MSDAIAAALAELDRRLSNIVRKGSVAALDATNALVQVDVGGITTDWLPWFTRRAGPDRDWWAPEVGEQCAVFSPSGELGQGVVMVGLYQDTHPAPEATADKHHAVYSDGTVIEYDRAAHALLVDASASNGSVTVKTGNGPVTVNAGSGSVTVNCGDASVNCTTAEVHASGSITLDSPTTTCTGDLIVEKHLSFLGGLSGQAGAGGGAAASITGPMQVSSGDLTVTGGQVSADGHTLKNHTHGGVQTGSGTTSGPTG